jgi:hypothetical protein
MKIVDKHKDLFRLRVNVDRALDAEGVRLRRGE